jgi:ribonuclease R
MSRRKKSSTPGGTSRTREKTYKHPLPGPKEIILALEQRGIPTPFDALARDLGADSGRPREALQRRLGKMVSAGKLLRNRKGEFCLLGKIEAVTGIISGHRDGFGFLVPDDGSEDIYLHFNDMHSLMNGDRAAVHPTGRGRRGKRAGNLVEILERARDSIVGRYHRERGVSYVVEENGKPPHTFLVANAHRNGAKHGELVKLAITDYPGARRAGQGRIAAVLGHPDDPGMITTTAIEIFGLPQTWSNEVSRAASRLGSKVAAADKADRWDLRDLPLVTIDGSDARDFDDAVFAEPDGDGWRLIVAIADVSHYVRPDDPIDVEAQKRGTSVYFADRVVPMLPEALSNELCSLKPNVDRLCMVCEMRVESSGKLGRAEFYRGVMRSHARLIYEDVDAAMTDRSPAARRRLKARLPQLEDLYAVYRALARARGRRGALDLDLPEVMIEMDEARHRIQAIVPRQRGDAHRLVEECMIAANVQAARYLGGKRLPALYRVHDGPNPDKFEELRLMMQALGFNVAESALKKPAELNKVLRQLSERPDFPMLATSVLRTMAQAVYQPANAGHYGLALPAYAHFTSPIRRYPDLLVHRGIGHLIDGLKPGRFEYSSADMDRLGKLTSMLERRAEEASRHVEGRLKCAYMEQHVGEEFEGVVTGVTHFGIFVTVSGVYVDGLVHVTGLPGDYYHLEHGGLCLAGERTGKRFCLGDTVRVSVAGVNVEEGKLDLELVNDAAVPRRDEVRKRKSRRRKGR